jgi:hypothetical protein
MNTTCHSLNDIWHRLHEVHKSYFTFASQKIKGNCFFHHVYPITIPQITTTQRTCLICPSPPGRGAPFQYPITSHYIILLTLYATINSNNITIYNIRLVMISWNVMWCLWRYCDITRHATTLRRRDIHNIRRHHQTTLRCHYNSTF